MNEMLKATLLVLALFILGSVGLVAQNDKAVSSSDRLDYLTPKAVELTQTSEKIIVLLNSKKGHLVELPVINKSTFDKEPLINVGKNLRIKEDLSVATLLKEMEQFREMENLSAKLGMEIDDKQYLDLYREAANWLGTKYRWGRMSTKGVDCSGLANIIYNRVFDKEIPRSSRDIAGNLSETLPAEHLLPGDLVFFATRGKRYINHVGVYLGDDRFVHASRSGVKVSNLNENYYKKTFKTAGRI